MKKTKLTKQKLRLKDIKVNVNIDDILYKAIESLSITDILRVIQIVCASRCANEGLYRADHVIDDKKLLDWRDGMVLIKYVQDHYPDLLLSAKEYWENVLLPESQKKFQEKQEREKDKRIDKYLKDNPEARPYAGYRGVGGKK